MNFINDVFTTFKELGLIYFYLCIFCIPLLIFYYWHLGCHFTNVKEIKDFLSIWFELISQWFAVLNSKPQFTWTTLITLWMSPSFTFYWILGEILYPVSMYTLGFLCGTIYHTYDRNRHNFSWLIQKFNYIFLIPSSSRAHYAPESDAPQAIKHTTISHMPQPYFSCGPYALVVIYAYSSLYMTNIFILLPTFYVKVAILTYFLFKLPFKLSTYRFLAFVIFTIIFFNVNTLFFFLASIFIFHLFCYHANHMEQITKLLHILFRRVFTFLDLYNYIMNKSVNTPSRRMDAILYLKKSSSYSSESSLISSFVNDMSLSLYDLHMISFDKKVSDHNLYGKTFCVNSLILRSIMAFQIKTSPYFPSKSTFNESRYYTLIRSKKRFTYIFFVPMLIQFCISYKSFDFVVFVLHNYFTYFFFVYVYNLYHHYTRSINKSVFDLTQLKASDSVNTTTVCERFLPQIYNKNGLIMITLFCFATCCVFLRNHIFAPQIVEESEWEDAQNLLPYVKEVKEREPNPQVTASVRKESLNSMVVLLLVHEVTCHDGTVKYVSSKGNAFGVHNEFHDRVCVTASHFLFLSLLPDRHLFKSVKLHSMRSIGAGYYFVFDLGKIKFIVFNNDLVSFDFPESFSGKFKCSEYDLGTTARASAAVSDSYSMVVDPEVTSLFKKHAGVDLSYSTYDQRISQYIKHFKERDAFTMDVVKHILKSSSPPLVKKFLKHSYKSEGLYDDKFWSIFFELVHHGGDFLVSQHHEEKDDPTFLIRCEAPTQPMCDKWSVFFSHSDTLCDLKHTKVVIPQSDMKVIVTPNSGGRRPGDCGTPVFVGADLAGLHIATISMISGYKSIAAVLPRKFCLSPGYSAQSASAVWGICPKSQKFDESIPMHHKDCLWPSRMHAAHTIIDYNLNSMGGGEVVDLPGWSHSAKSPFVTNDKAAAIFDLTRDFHTIETGVDCMAGLRLYTAQGGGPLETSKIQDAYDRNSIKSACHDEAILDTTVKVMVSEFRKVSELERVSDLYKHGPLTLAEGFNGIKLGGATLPSIDHTSSMGTGKYPGPVHDYFDKDPDGKYIFDFKSQEFVDDFKFLLKTIKVQPVEVIIDTFFKAENIVAAQEKAKKLRIICNLSKLMVVLIRMYLYPLMLQFKVLSVLHPTPYSDNPNTGHMSTVYMNTKLKNNYVQVGNHDFKGFDLSITSEIGRAVFDVFTYYYIVQIERHEVWREHLPTIRNIFSSLMNWCIVDRNMKLPMTGTVSGSPLTTIFNIMVSHMAHVYGILKVSSAYSNIPSPIGPSIRAVVNINLYGDDAAITVCDNDYGLTIPRIHEAICDLGLTLTCEPVVFDDSSLGGVGPVFLKRSMVFNEFMGTFNMTLGFVSLIKCFGGSTGLTRKENACINIDNYLANMLMSVTFELLYRGGSVYSDYMYHLYQYIDNEHVRDVLFVLVSNTISYMMRVPSEPSLIRKVIFGLDHNVVFNVLNELHRDSRDEAVKRYKEEALLLGITPLNHERWVRIPLNTDTSTFSKDYYTSKKVCKVDFIPVKRVLHPAFCDMVKHFGLSVPSDLLRFYTSSEFYKFPSHSPNLDQTNFSLDVPDFTETASWHSPEMTYLPEAEHLDRIEIPPFVSCFNFWFSLFVSFYTKILKLIFFIRDNKSDLKNGIITGMQPVFTVMGLLSVYDILYRYYKSDNMGAKQTIVRSLCITSVATLALQFNASWLVSQSGVVSNALTDKIIPIFSDSLLKRYELLVSDVYSFNIHGYSAEADGDESYFGFLRVLYDGFRDQTPSLVSRNFTKHLNSGGVVVVRKAAEGVLLLLMTAIVTKFGVALNFVVPTVDFDAIVSKLEGSIKESSVTDIFLEALTHVTSLIIKCTSSMVVTREQALFQELESHYTILNGAMVYASDHKRFMVHVSDAGISTTVFNTMTLSSAMSDLVLKFKSLPRDPKTFLIINTYVASLSNSIREIRSFGASGKCPPPFSITYSGPPGIGKTVAANSLIQLLLAKAVIKFSHIDLSFMLGPSKLDDQGKLSYTLPQLEETDEGHCIAPYIVTDNSCDDFDSSKSDTICSCYHDPGAVAVGVDVAQIVKFIGKSFSIADGCFTANKPDLPNKDRISLTPTVPFLYDDDGVARTFSAPGFVLVTSNDFFPYGAVLNAVSSVGAARRLVTHNDYTTYFQIEINPDYKSGTSIHELLDKTKDLFTDNCVPNMCHFACYEVIESDLEDQIERRVWAYTFKPVVFTVPSSLTKTARTGRFEILNNSVDSIGLRYFNRISDGLFGEKGYLTGKQYLDHMSDQYCKRIQDTMDFASKSRAVRTLPLGKTE